MYSFMQQALRGIAGQRKVIVTLVMVATVGGLASTPAFAENNNSRGHRAERGGDNRRDAHDNRRGNSRRYNCGRGWNDGCRHYDYSPSYRRPYSYAQPVYVPRPLYYGPRQSPGISLFLPFDQR